MKFAIVLLIVILNFQSQVFAQEGDTLVGINNSYKTRKINELSGSQFDNGFKAEPFLSHDFNNGFNSPGFMLPLMNFNFLNSWKEDLGIGSTRNTPFRMKYAGVFQTNVWDSYTGIYGIRTYQLNNKLSVGTAGYSERSFNEYLVKSGLNRQTNYGSSLFVGYKFSDKFNISASFNFRPYGDRYHGNQGMLNGSFFP